MKTDLPYYNYSRLLSYNGVYNFAVGGRGIGKTYGAKKMLIRNYIRKGEQFVFLRRYEDELTAAKSTFANDVMREFPKEKFRVKGNQFEMVTATTGGEVNEKTGKPSPVVEEWSIVGYFLVLSKAQDYKGTSFPRVTTMIFDEFIIEKGFKRYLPDEHIVFNNLYSTIDRNTNRVRVFFLANSVSINNPYFDEYEIRPDQLPEISSHFPVYDHKTGNTIPFIVVHFIESKKFTDAVYKTVFGQFIANTDYAKYAIENQFSDAHDELVEGKCPCATYKFTLETPRLTFSVWHCRDHMRHFILRSRPKKELMFTIIPENMAADKTLMKLNDKPLKLLRSAFSNARVYFDQPRTRNAFVSVLRD